MVQITIENYDYEQSLIVKQMKDRQAQMSILDNSLANQMGSIVTSVAIKATTGMNVTIPPKFGLLSFGLAGTIFNLLSPKEKQKRSISQAFNKLVQQYISNTNEYNKLVDARIVSPMTVNNPIANNTIVPKVINTPNNQTSNSQILGFIGLFLGVIYLAKRSN